ncbi:MAG TPA: HDOD domain-containing protein, partial [Gaiellaceae bacterium]|nr:HDOD domain-containing protein [Gaiellaceae bacterium]
MEHLVERALALPLGDRVALVRVASLCSDPEVAPAEVALLAARDEAFSALLLKIANSTWSGSMRPIADLTHAIVRLGTSLVQGIALAAPGLRLLESPADGLGPARRELHRHAVRVGIVARSLATDNATSEQALAAGLVHNLGLNVIAVTATETFRLLADAGRQGDQLP